MRSLNQNKPQKLNLSFGGRAATALAISIAADALDYVGAPIFDLPVVGDIADGIVIAILYRLTGSKISAAVNAIELIPFIGDLIPTYTITSVAWILRELSKRKEEDGSSSGNRRNALLSHNKLVSISQLMSGQLAVREGVVNVGEYKTNTAHDSLKTKAMRLYSIFRSRAR